MRKPIPPKLMQREEGGARQSSGRNQKLASQTRMFMERISNDINLQKNENCRMRRSYNPILEDLLEAEEREVERETALAQLNESKQENLKFMEEEYNQRLLTN